MGSPAAAGTRSGPSARSCCVCRRAWLRASGAAARWTPSWAYNDEHRPREEVRIADTSPRSDRCSRQEWSTPWVVGVEGGRVMSDTRFADTREYERLCEASAAMSWLILHGLARA
jgi:hypothetical protein